MTCERISGQNVDIFICKRREQCVCGATARARCGVDGCGKSLCDKHARKVGDEPRCAKHAPMTTNPTMPRPPPRMVEEEGNDGND